MNEFSLLLRMECCHIPNMVCRCHGRKIAKNYISVYLIRLIILLKVVLRYLSIELSVNHKFTSCSSDHPVTIAQGRSVDCNRTLTLTFITSHPMYIIVNWVLPGITRYSVRAAREFPDGQWVKTTMLSIQVIKCKGYNQ